MESINSQVVVALQDGGVPLPTIEQYTALLPPTTDNLETIGCFWAQQIARLNVNIRTYADVCMCLRDTTSEVLWLNFFRERVIPIIKEHQLLLNGVAAYG